MGEFGAFLVTPEYLNRSAQVMEAYLQSALREYMQIVETVKETESCFRGKSAEKIRRSMEKKAEKGMDLVEELKTLADRLSQISEEYAAAERENEGNANRN